MGGAAMTVEEAYYRGIHAAKSVVADMITEIYSSHEGHACVSEFELRREFSIAKLLVLLDQLLLPTATPLYEKQ